jgi:hypothetical protein
VGDEDVVADDPGFGGRVAFGRLLAVGGVAGSEDTEIVAENGAAVGLVEGDPVLHLGEGLVHDAGVADEVGDEFILVEEALIAVVEFVGKVPVEECDQRSDAGGEKVIDELDIVVETLLVDGVIPTAKRDHTGPRDGEAIGHGTSLLQQLDVLGMSVVRVTGNVAG